MTSGLQTYKQKLTTTAKTEYVKSETKKTKIRPRMLTRIIASAAKNVTIDFHSLLLKQAARHLQSTMEAEAQQHSQSIPAISSELVH